MHPRYDTTPEKVMRAGYEAQLLILYTAEILAVISVNLITELNVLHAPSEYVHGLYVQLGFINFLTLLSVPGMIHTLKNIYEMSKASDEQG